MLIVIAGAAIPEYFAVTTTKSLNKRSILSTKENKWKN